MCLFTNPHSSSPCLPSRVASIPFTPAQSLLLKDWECEDAFNHPEEEPPEGAAAHAFPEGCPFFRARSTPRSPLYCSSRSNVCPAEVMCSIAFSGQQSSVLQSPLQSLAWLLRLWAWTVQAWGQPACGDRGTQLGHPGRQQGPSLPKGRSKICCRFGGAALAVQLLRDSVARLCDGWLTTKI